jgi:formylglycine-generating enzyme required for sulfatase activity
MSWEHNPTSTTEEQPAVCLGYDDMKAYTNWLSQKSARYYRLMTEAEYEYTARAGTTTIFFFGENPDDLCAYGNVDDLTAKEEAEAKGELAPTAPPGWPNCRDGVGLRTAPVGSYKPNPWGLNDTYGQVWQRVEDCYHTSYKDAPSDGSVAWTYGIKNGNGVPVDCGYRVVRGGGWRNAVFHFRPANRYGDYPDYHRADYLGFRVARALEPEPARPGPSSLLDTERERAENPPQ